MVVRSARSRSSFLLAECGVRVGVGASGSGWEPSVVTRGMWLRAGMVMVMVIDSLSILL